MKVRTLLVLAVLIPLALGVLVYAESISENQAYQAFVKAGCTECHDGSSAPDWKETVEIVRSWAMQYDTIDEAVQNEYTFAGGADSYAEMMAVMREYTEGVTDEQFNILYQFFIQVFEEARASRPQQTTTPPPRETIQASTVTVTETKTITRTKTITETITKVVTETRESTVIVTEKTEPLEGRLTPTTLNYAPLIGLILALAGFSYLVLTARGAGTRPAS